MRLEVRKRELSASKREEKRAAARGNGFAAPPIGCYHRRILEDLDVSVIVPTHRREKLVVRAVASALAQRDTRLEVLVLDDTDEGSARDHPRRETARVRLARVSSYGIGLP